ncbi:unnamed protein product, partial [Choristocarpus tenellus]
MGKSPTRVLKNATAVAGAMSLGDLVCQGVEEYDKMASGLRWDSDRTLRMGITGAFVVTPMSFSWNLLAEGFFPGASWKALCGKLGVQIVCMAPMVAAQFTALTLLEGKGAVDVQHRLDQDLVPTLKAGICYWPFVGLFSSRYVPVMNRPAVSAFAGVFWNVYLSHRAHHNELTLDKVSESGGEGVELALGVEGKGNGNGNGNGGG